MLALTPVQGCKIADLKPTPDSLQMAEPFALDADQNTGPFTSK